MVISRGKLGAVIAAIGGIAMIVGKYLETGDIPNFQQLTMYLTVIGGALSLYGIRSAQD